jgi:NAD(P)-dependent dehydrogenase (short-subunit alcohol dehydrogenase family)
MELAERVAIVTGGGRGIGRAIALELAGMGADVVVAERDPETGETAAEAVRGLGRRAVALQTDVTSRADLDVMVRTTLEQLGKIDILINNAGIFRAALPHDVSEEHWDAIMEINTKAVFFASQAVLPTMMEARSGTIVSLASMAGKLGMPNNAPYAASKAAVISLTKSLAMAYASYGIRVNCVCPGFVETEMWREVYRQAGAGIMNLSYEEFHTMRLGMVPLGRLETPEDVAKVVGFLASDRAGYMTGQAINVTGGIVMH